MKISNALSGLRLYQNIPSTQNGLNILASLIKYIELIHLIKN